MPSPNPGEDRPVGLSTTDLPALNASLNALSAILLLKGYLHIRQGRIADHRRFMLGALASSAAFLVSYLTYHATVGSVPYPLHDWTRTLYFIILVPHIILAAIMGPFILVMVYHALRENFQKHRRLARWVWPVWMFVSATGVAVYLLLYQYALRSASA